MKVVLIGAGNVGFHLGKALVEAGVDVVQVFGRTLSKVRDLAKRLNCAYTRDLNKIDPTAQLYILAVKDDAITTVAQTLNFIDKEKLVVHTSGGTSSKVLSPFFPNSGVFYPLQTFSIKREVNFSEIPICVDAVRPDSLQLLTDLAECLSVKVIRVNDEERVVLHIAAVFANNFSNHMFAISEKICEEKNLNFDILKPLIRETVNKAITFKASSMQTGPAIRGDKKTMDAHLEYLNQNPDFRELYYHLSESIKKFYS